MLLFDFDGERFADVHAQRYHEMNAREFYHGTLSGAPVRGRCALRVEKVALACMSIMSIDMRMGAHFRRTAQDIRDHKVDVFVLWSVENGQFRVSHSDGTRSTAAGEMTLVSSREPMMIEPIVDSSGVFKSKMALVPGHLFRSELSDCRELLGHSIAALSGEGRVLQNLIDMLYDEGERLSADTHEALMRQSLRSLRHIRGALVTINPRATTSDVNLRKVQRCIELNFSNPDLSASQVATMCAISIRYLHLLLKNAGTSYSDLLWNNRLAKAKEWFQAPHMAHYSITEIAFMAGFKNSAHFSRSFRRKFAVSPKEFRSAVGNTQTRV